MHFPLLQDMVILLGFSVIIVFILHRFRLPSILGFLITGIIIGPYGLSLIGAVDEVEIISEIGVILLLFVIGMELSLKQLVSMRKTVFIGGLLQVVMAVIAAAIIFKYFGFSWNEAVFIGFLFSLSSTAIVLKILQDRDEISTPQGRNALGILIFQDIIVVPMMLVAPIMAGQTTNIGMAALALLLKSGLVVIITYVSARYLVPRLMHKIAQTKNKELFLLTTITICFAITFLTSEAGLSLALGAFLAGLIISESDYGHHATGIILPFRELFTSIFFISIGMLLNLNFFIDNVGLVLLLVLVVFLLKGSIVAITIALLKYPPRVIFLTALALFQIGEFAFILSRIGIKYDLLTFELNQFFLSVSITTMLLTPFVIHYSEKILSVLKISKLQNKYADAYSGSLSFDASNLENHLVIIGYGINGSNVARAARHAKIPYVILELNADTVKNQKSKGEPIVFGDATQQHILSSIKLKKARVVIIAISDSKATKHIVASIRTISKSVYLIVRTRYIKEIDDITALGADEVIPEEFETSVEIFSRVLHNYLVPLDEIEKIINSIRADNYNLFHPHVRLSDKPIATHIPDFKISSVCLTADSGKVVGKTIAEANIRLNFGVNILAISRKEDLISHIKPEEKLVQNDVVYISGNPAHIESFYKAAR